MAPLTRILGTFLLPALTLAQAKYEEYILAPSSRTLYPRSVYNVNGTVDGADSLTGDSGSATFKGESAVTFDFGINIAGIVTLQIGSVDQDEEQHIGLTYTESSQWISSEGSDATADAGLDEILWFQPDAPGDYTVERQHERGAFRYLSLLHNTTGSLEVQAVTVHYTPMPHWKDDALRDYTGYFHCDDELLNRVWYAGAYTNQICTIDPNHGDALVHLGEITKDQNTSEVGQVTWYNNLTIANGSSVLTDGAKRDRLVWAGDMAIAVPAIVVSYDDLVSVANALDSLFVLQTEDGQLPYAGVGFRREFSFTYHLYTLIGVADYYLYADALDYLQGKWEAWKLAMSYSLSTIDSSGLANVTSSNDWLRFGMGGHNIEANAILYYTIQQGLTLGRVLNESQALLSNWSSTAERLKTAANARLWDESSGLYFDNETTTLHPQDGNSWAVVANLTSSLNQSAAISSALSDRWGEYGAPAPEAGDAVSPFITGFELQAHLLSQNVDAALKLMRRQWGFMLNDPRMTNSTFLEGYSTTGEIHYAPYNNDPRVSHAHGWATGPTSTLTFYIGGIHWDSAGGRTWTISPRLGYLKSVDVGFTAGMGKFAVTVEQMLEDEVTGMRFETPEGTVGRVDVPNLNAVLRRESDGMEVEVLAGLADRVPGGVWEIVGARPGEGNVESPPAPNGTVGGGHGNATVGSGVPEPFEGSAAVGSFSLMAALVGVVAFAL
ncbi:hypothetical protein MBLNU230_g2038t1 [Neophaeotheca triangularis]